ncbi:MAG: hypothetical protein GX111_05435 [Clostridiales bacterium]|nr:hypothetical protein [Clostridiales bacterium]
MPDIAQCKICKKPFQSFGGHTCHNCLVDVDAAQIKIRDYLYDNPQKSGIDDICEGTDVSRNIVLYLLKEKRLTVSESSDSAPTCIYCHRPIGNGLMCDECRALISNKLQYAAPKPTKKKSPDDSRRSQLLIDLNR